MLHLLITIRKQSSFTRNKTLFSTTSYQQRDLDCQIVIWIIIIEIIRSIRLIKDGARRF